MNSEHLLWVWLKIALRDSSVKTYRIYQQYGDINLIYNLTSKEIETLEFLSPEDKPALLDKQLTSAEHTLRLCQANNIEIVTINDDKYPSNLKEIHNPPCVLFYYGNYDRAFSKPIFTIVGTRSCTTYGEAVAANLSSAIAMCGFTIACGVASGIDAFVYESAIKADGNVIAVVPDGLLSNNLYTKYKFRNIRYNGVIISELLPQCKTRRYAYQERNRILSGISLGTLVIQAPKSSGALMTASYALNQGRDVFAVPANIDMHQSYGSNKLIKDGAIPVLDYTDIVEYYYPKYKDYITANVKIDTSLINSYEEESLSKVEHFKQTVMPMLEPDERIIFEYMSSIGITLDVLTEKSGLPISRVLGILSSLEAKGAITACPGGMYKIIL